MLDLLLTLIGRLTDLAKYRGERQRRIFADVLDPVFQELQLVHGNYCAMFEEVERTLLAAADSKGNAAHAQVLAVAEKLRQRRVEFEPVRVKVAAFARETLGGRFAKSKRVVFSKEVDELLRAIVNYFPSGYVQSDVTSLATALYVALRSSADPITSEQVNKDGDALQGIIQETLRHCRENWATVCKRHAALRVAVAAAD